MRYFPHPMFLFVCLFMFSFWWNTSFCSFLGKDEWQVAFGNCISENILVGCRILWALIFCVEFNAMLSCWVRVKVQIHAPSESAGRGLPFPNHHFVLKFQPMVHAWLLEKSSLWLYGSLVAKWYFCFLIYHLGWSQLSFQGASVF